MTENSSPHNQTTRPDGCDAIDWRRFLEQTLPIGLFEWIPDQSPRTDLHESGLIMADSAFYRMLAWTGDELNQDSDKGIGVPLKKLCDHLQIDDHHRPSDAVRFQSEKAASGSLLELIKSLQPGQSYDLIVNLKQNEKRYFRLILRHMPDSRQALGILIDISEQMETQEKIHMQSELLSQLQQAGRVGAWSFDLATMEVTWSHELYEIWGLDPKTYEPSYENWIATIHPEDRTYVNEIVSHHIEHARSYEIDHRIVTGDGELLYIHGVGRPMFDHAGTLVRYTGTAQDITREIDLEQARLSLQKTLRKTMQLEAVGTLAGGAAHDFNNALTVISAYTEELKDMMAADWNQSAIDEASQCLNIIHEACQRASSVSYAMLNFSGRSHSQIDTGRFQVFDLSQITQSSLKLLSRLLPGSIEVEINIEDSQMPFEGHPGQIDQLLMNLVINAREAMPDGGNLNVVLHKLEPLEESSAPKARLTIRDTGVGIPQEVISQIFQPFFTTRQSKYAGMGLSVVKDLVKQHHGSIDISSQENIGTTVQIELPLLKEELQQPKSAVATSKAEGLILLAEDNDFVASIMQTTLKRAGHDVLHVNSGPSALEKYQQYARELDLLICDIDLPGCSGLSVLKSLSEISDNLVCVAITGDHSRDVANQIPEGTKLLNKPFTMSQLTELVAEILQNKH